MTTISPQAVLDVVMPENDAGAATIRDYLVKLLTLVWEEGESFDGKRPFGNSGWEGELIQALARVGIIEGVAGEDSEWVEVDLHEDDRACRLIHDAIRYLGRPVPTV